MPKQAPAHKSFIRMLKELRGLPQLDNTEKYNMIFAINIDKRLRQEIARVKGIKTTEVEIDEVLQAFETFINIAEKDDWIRPRMTDLGILYRNFGRIIQ